MKKFRFDPDFDVRVDFLSALVELTYKSRRGRFAFVLHQPSIPRIIREDTSSHHPQSLPDPGAFCRASGSMNRNVSDISKYEISRMCVIYRQDIGAISCWDPVHKGFSDSVIRRLCLRILRMDEDVVICRCCLFIVDVCRMLWFFYI